MFEEFEDLADNVEDEEDVDQSTSPVEQVDQTKAFATRLKEEKAKAKEEAKNEIAQSFGYANWQEYADAQRDSQLLEKGLDPESVRPVIKDFLKSDPDYIEAMRYKAEKEELEKELFATNAIQALNAKFGTDYKSINDLDADTIDMWNKGTPLEKAFAANNYSQIVNAAIKKAGAVRDSGKSHMKTVTGSNEQTKVREASKGEIDAAKAMGYTAEQLQEYINRTKK